MTTPPSDLVTLQREIAKLKRINEALMDRVERSTDLGGGAFSLFQTAITLEERVRDRTRELGQAMHTLAEANAELRRTRDAAEIAQGWLRDAIDSINEGFALFDSEDRLVLCNATYLGLWPRLADRIKPGMTFQEIAGMIAAEGVTLGAMVVPDRWLSDRIAQHSIADGAHVHALADGRWIQINELRTFEGGIVGVYTDITDVKVADARLLAKQLAEKSALLQATLDTMPHGVAVYDANHRLTVWNRPFRRLLSLPDGVVARTATHERLTAFNAGLGSAGMDPAALAWDAAGPATEQVWQGRTLEVRRATMPDGGLVLTFADVTERRQFVEALRHGDELREAKRVAEAANLSKTRFLAAASHDLLQPLNAARLFVAALAERRLASESRALVDRVESALLSVEDLLESLLEISVLDAHAVQPHRNAFALQPLLANLLAEFAPAARARGVELGVVETSAVIDSDARLLRRILQNFISNALRYGTGKRIVVGCRRAGDSVRVEVVDSGPGIAPDKHRLIFDEFARLEGDVRGIGLGLAIVERTAQLLDHPIALRSVPGRGSAFGVTVPVAPGRLDAPTGIVPPPPRRSPIDGVRLLVIDNERAVLDGMAALLGGWSCVVATAADLAGALAHVAAGFDPELIIADYHLDKGASGSAAVAAVRHRLGRQVPALIVTADRTPELQAAMAAAGLAMQSKPIKPAQLRALVTRLVEP